MKLLCNKMCSIKMLSSLNILCCYHLSVASGKLTEKYPILLSLLGIVSLHGSIYLYNPSLSSLSEPFTLAALFCSLPCTNFGHPCRHLFAHISFFLSWRLVFLFSAHLNGLFPDSSLFLWRLLLVVLLWMPEIPIICPHTYHLIFFSLAFPIVSIAITSQSDYN